MDGLVAGADSVMDNSATELGRPGDHPGHLSGVWLSDARYWFMCLLPTATGALAK